MKDMVFIPVIRLEPGVYLGGPIGKDFDVLPADQRHRHGSDFVSLPYSLESIKRRLLRFRQVEHDSKHKHIAFCRLSDITFCRTVVALLMKLQ